MSNLNRFCLALVLVVVLLGMRIAPAAACTCAVNPSPGEEFDLSAAVFTGRVVQIDLLRGTGVRTPVRVTLETETVWKGPVRNNMVVFTAIDSGACGFAFNVGWTYLVYARGPESALEVSSCTRTRVVSQAGTDLIDLGAGVRVLDGWQSGRTPAMLIVGLVLTITALWVVRRRRSAKISWLREQFKD